MAGAESAYTRKIEENVVHIGLLYSPLWERGSSVPVSIIVSPSRQVRPAPPEKLFNRAVFQESFKS